MITKQLVVLTIALLGKNELIIFTSILMFFLRSSEIKLINLYIKVYHRYLPTNYSLFSLYILRREVI